ncbi:MAG TPA: hypothetical protein VHF22_05180 [Planctomycetota bacterium]|nr:hypothetical protein [Planctomycetota bacterium]
MRRFTEIALAAATGAALAAIVGAGRPAAAAPPPPAQKWDYHVEVCSYADYKDMEEYRAIEKELNNGWRAQFAWQQRVLQRAGAEGFELVQVLVPKSPSESVFYFRRPVEK